MEKVHPPKALVLFSGGLDSTTCLYYAKKEGFSIWALSFDYGQKHKIELEKAQKIAQLAQVEEHIFLKLDFSTIARASALTSADIPVPLGGKHLGKEEYIPPTYVPGRNLVFLSYAIALSESNHIKDIFVGVNALDYSGYPDCRADFIESFKKTANLATKKGREEGFTIHTPLINLTKLEILKLAFSLKVPVEDTWSCYNPQMNESGDYKPCGLCDSCLLREKAFAALKEEFC